jgi:hypothetical protein
MPRRKIVGGAEEVSYRLLNIMRSLGKVNGAQALAALGALAGYAHMEHVDLGEDFRQIVRRVVTGAASKTESYIPKTSVPDGTVTGPTEGEKEPLTIEPPDDIFGGLEEDDES